MGKLVRDNIPQIISDDGGFPSTRILDDKEYLRELEDKISEEYEEFLEDHKLEEIADLLEALRAYLKAKGSSYKEVEALRKKKLEIRGGFEKKIYLEDVKSS